jgi:hypothetical protein
MFRGGCRTAGRGVQDKGFYGSTARESTGSLDSGAVKGGVPVSRQESQENTSVKKVRFWFWFLCSPHSLHAAAERQDLIFLFERNEYYHYYY